MAANAIVANSGSGSLLRLIQFLTTCGAVWRRASVGLAWIDIVLNDVELRESVSVFGHLLEGVAPFDV